MGVDVVEKRIRETRRNLIPEIPMSPFFFLFFFSFDTEAL